MVIDMTATRKVARVAKVDVRALAVKAGRTASQSSTAMTALMLELMGSRKPDAKRYKVAAEGFKVGYITDALRLNAEDRAIKVLKMDGKARTAAQQAAYKAAGVALSRAMKIADIANPSAKAGNANAKRGTKSAGKALHAEHKAETAVVKTMAIKSIADVNRAFRMALNTLETVCKSNAKMAGMMDYANLVHEALAKLPKLEAK
jgi:hypothetical protein